MGTKKLNGISNRRELNFDPMGNINAATPRITKVLIILLPIILVKAMSVVFESKEAIKFTTNSGVEVPKATTVSPITKSDTLNLLANPEAPSTKKCAPRIKTRKPISIYK
jgi:hypothetical protein